MGKDKPIINDYEQERQRLMNLFAESDEVKRAVLEGLVDEAAKCRVELRRLSQKRDDLVARNAPFSATVRMDNLIIKLRASYTNISDKLCRWLAVADSEDWDAGLDDYQ